MPAINWRKGAKEVLYLYPETCRLLRRQENDILLGSKNYPDQRYRRGGLVDSTGTKAILLQKEEILRLTQEKRAVEALLEFLDSDRRIDQLRRELLMMVYLRDRVSLIHAAIALEVSDRTAKRWNDQLLRFVALEMGWLELKDLYAPGRFSPHFLP